MSDNHLKQKSRIKDRQLGFLTAFRAKLLPKSPDQADIDQVIQDVAELYADSHGEPLFRPRRAERNQLPYREEMQYNMEEITEDIHILSDEQQAAGGVLKDAFNTVQSENKRLTHRLDGLNSLAGDLLLLAGDQRADALYIKESFNRTDSLDTAYAIDSVSKGAIHTGEGILTLGRKDARNLALNARIAHVSGNGTPGVDHIVRRFAQQNAEGETSENYQFINADDPQMHTQKENILDDRPDTLFQYQRLNVPDSFKRERRYFDFDWAEGTKDGDRLRMKLVIELDQEETLNWLTLHPYYGGDDGGRVVVRSIQTSKDGFDYQPLYAGTQELNQTINATPETYRLEDIFTGANTPEAAQYSGKGVWSFPEREARFVELVIDQPQSQPELLGQAVYTLRIPGSTYSVQVPEPEELKMAAPGEYIRTVDGERVVYKKEIQATTQGWRYAIGLRDIGLMQQTYDTQSYFVSKRHALPRAIEKVVLYAKEIIPKDYLAIIEKNNDWIQYEVSFDDSTWHRISPMHHEPLNDAFPAKILEVNTQRIDSQNAFAVHKQLVLTDDQPTHIRLRVTLKRPDGEQYAHTTPIVEEVALKIETKGAAAREY